MTKDKDPMGSAIYDYWHLGKAAPIKVFSPMFDEDEMPVEILFRTYEEMPTVEQKALDLATGRTLDVGAGAGCHTLELQKRGINVTSIDISPLSVLTMQERGVRCPVLQDYYTLTSTYDTILMLMNGIGIVGSVNNFQKFFEHLNCILAPGGQLLFDSSDLCYLFEDEDGIIELPETDKYYGELTYQLQYKNICGEPFNWTYIDAETMQQYAERYGYTMEVLKYGEHYDYLARITKTC